MTLAQGPGRCPHDCGVNNRGVALWRDKVISHTLDGRLLATGCARAAQERLSILSPLSRTRLALDVGAQLRQREAIHEVANSEDRRNRVRLRNQRLLSGRSLSS
jgi:hypothetical protein